MTLREIKKVARIINKRFSFKALSIKELPNTRCDQGECCQDGHIMLRLKQYKKNKPLARRTVIHTLCHELAHLQYFDHNKGHEELTQLIYLDLKDSGIIDGS